MVTLWKGDYKLCRFWTNLLCLAEEEKLRLNNNNLYDRADIEWGGRLITYRIGNPIPTIIP
jgi:hypothetical protein